MAYEYRMRRCLGCGITYKEPHVNGLPYRDAYCASCAGRSMSGMMYVAQIVKYALAKDTTLQVYRVDDIEKTVTAEPKNPPPARIVYGRP